MKLLVSESDLAPAGSDEDNAAQVLQAQERFAEAEALFREALDNNRRIYGEDHPHVLTGKNNLAVVFQRQKRPE